MKENSNKSQLVEFQTLLDNVKGLNIDKHIRSVKFSF